MRLEPDGLARMAAFMEESGADLACGVPRQERVAFSERLLIPLIHFVLLALALSVAAAAMAAETSAPAASRQITGFELPDQHDKEHRYHFPKANLSLLTVADQKGSAQVESWAKPVRERYGAKVDIDGVADMSAVPGFVRNMVTGQFKKRQQYPVMLDWTGKVCRQLGGPKGQAGILLIDREGRVLREWHGHATEGTLRELFATIDKAKP